MNKTFLLEKAKELNLPRRNCMETKEELEKAIKDNITKYKENIFGPDTPVCMTCLHELESSKSSIKKLWSKVDGWCVKEIHLDELHKNIVMDGDT